MKGSKNHKKKRIITDQIGLITAKDQWEKVFRLFSHVCSLHALLIGQWIIGSIELLKLVEYNQETFIFSACIALQISHCQFWVISCMKPINFNFFLCFKMCRSVSIKTLKASPSFSDFTSLPPCFLLLQMGLHKKERRENMWSSPLYQTVWLP